MRFIYQKRMPFFDRVPGGYFALIGAIIFLMMLIISISLHSLTDSVDWRRHFVSNMGIGPNGANIAFSVGTFFQALLLYPLIIHAGQQLWMNPTQPKARLNNILLMLAFCISMVSIPGLMMVAFFSMAPTTIIPHAIGASLFFFGTILYGGAFWLSMEIQKKSTFIMRLLSITVIGFFIAFMGACGMIIVQYPEEYQLFMASPMDYTYRILGDTTDTKLEYIRIFEWLFILAMVGWCLYLSVYSAIIFRKKFNSS